jgi:hypothetical protein
MLAASFKHLKKPKVQALPFSQLLVVLAPLHTPLVLVPPKHTHRSAAQVAAAVQVTLL